MTHSSEEARPAVLITGCSSGIGEACARDLAERGWRVYAGVRKAADAQRLRQAAVGLETLLLDVTDADSIGAAAAELERALGGSGLTGLVNNAGIFLPGPFELLSVEDLRRQLEVNVVGTHAVTRAMLPLLRRAGGRIVLMGSVSGRVTLPFCGAYAASKHALEAMTDALRMELRPWRISVSIVEPAAVGTPIWSKFDRAVARTPRSAGGGTEVYEEQLLRVRKAALGIARSATPPAAVVRAVRHALLARRPRPRYAVGWSAKLAAWGAAHLPVRLMDRLLLRTMGLP